MFSSEALLAEQAKVLEQIVRGAGLEIVLPALCRIVETHADDGPVRAAISLVGGDGRRLHTSEAPGLPDPRAHRRGAAWSTPILSSTGLALGTFDVYLTENREPRPWECGLVEVMTRTAALAIERERADGTLRDEARRQLFLAELSAVTQTLIEPADVMQTSARMLAEHLDVDRCAYAPVEDERVFNIAGDYTRGDVPTIVGDWEVAAFGPGCVSAMLAGEPFVVDDTDRDPRIGPDDLPAYRATTIRSVVCVPLHKQGRFTAAMAVHRNKPWRWSAEEIELVTIVVARCWEALERVRVTRNLRDSEERYRTMVEATPECVKLVARDGTLLQMNAAGLRALEIEDAAFAIGSNIYDVVAPEHRERFRQFNEQVCRGQAGVIEFDIIGRAGTRRSMETTAVPLAAPGGGFRQLAITRDVSARVAAARALAESRARVDYAVRLSGVGFWYCDLPFDELQWDAQVKSHFFLPPDACVTIDTFYAQIHADDRENTRVAIDASIREGRSYDVTYRTCDPSTGAMKWIRALGGATYADDGTPIRFDGVTVDVSEKARLYEQLREQDRRKDEFLATLAHELRNPLAPIRTGIQVLGLGAAQSEQATKLLPMMDRQLGHLVHMVDDLLDISRITLGKVSLKRQRIDIRTALDSALETTRTLIEARGHELAVRLSSDPLPVDVDPTRLSQVFANLLNNAAKYTPPGGRILIAAESQDDTLYVRVEDTGVGIPEDMLSRVFDMFTQVGRSLDRSQGGLGIGLTLVRRIVEMHGGSVNAESPGIGKGSTFTVRLPLAMRDARLAAVTATERDSPGARPPLRILIVDDNVDAAETLAMLLELGGNVTRLAHDGRAALEMVSEFRPELVFLDIGLPELNGYQVAARLRADPTITQPMLVAVTGWGSEEDRKQAHVAGFDRHLVKPIDSAKLEAVLASTRP